jgi:isomerase DpgB
MAIRRRLMLDAATAAFEDALGRHLAACDRALRQTDTVRPGTAYPPAPTS